MISSWRRRRSAGRLAGKEKLPLDGGAGDIELTIPSHFRCPISLDLMKDPVTLTTGITYDRQSIETWIESGNVTCPITNQVLRSLEPIPNHTIRKMIQDWCVQNKSYGIERIPTPRIPISSDEVSEILFKITEAAERRDREKCKELVMKLKDSMKESEGNKRRIMSNGAGKALAAAFEALSSSEKAVFDENRMGILEELLSALTLFFPLDEEAKCVLGLESSLHCMVRLMEAGDLSRRRNSVLVIKQIVSSNPRKIAAMAEIEGAMEALVKLIKEPICPTPTKASLMVMYHMVSSSFSNDKIRERFVEMGLVPSLLEMIVGSERSVCDKALGVLDGICSCKKGREEAYGNALTMPVLVKKILRVSDSATEFSVSIIWKLCKSREDEGDDNEERIIRAVVEALQVGAFQKLLLVLQVGCGERLKEETSDLLKVLNLHRRRVECIDSMDFKDLKRPF
ncbi:U-box domain-containing protein 20 [Morus notabilis]|uniref:U-box domain-containing protein n=1 Tax=Morus notabilis TaxID=981085 RepID=W9RRX1_9ROSA|nr:U-box domain-containing protein 21 [Morus notabilis]EXC05057.1 U-box domain-containing protein 20 [Morus notabilis]